VRHTARAKSNPEERVRIHRARARLRGRGKLEKRRLDRPYSSENRLTKHRDKGPPFLDDVLNDRVREAVAINDRYTRNADVNGNRDARAAGGISARRRDPTRVTVLISRVLGGRGAEGGGARVRNRAIIGTRDARLLSRRR